MSVSLLVGLLPYWNYTNIGISLVLDEISFWNLLETFLGCWKIFQIILNFLYICHSVGRLISLLKIDKYRYIWSSGWDIFMEFFGDISGMLVGQFQIFLNFMYVCQSVSWLTSLLKLYKYWDIVSSAWDIFLKFFGDIPGSWYTIF